MPRVAPGQRKRAYRPKTRTGCHTCRIRRVKCDEARPSCYPCVSTGRKCDGYEPNTESPPDLPIRVRGALNRSPSAGFLGTEEECRSFSFFRQNTVSQLSAFFGGDFWDTLLLQATSHEPSIRHAILALGSLHAKYEQHKGLVMPSRTDKSTDEFALKNYGQAIHVLVEPPSQKGQQAIDVYLICCILFACLETMQSSFGSAITHVQSGMKILYETKYDEETRRHQHDVLRASEVPYLSIRMLEEIFMRIDLQVTQMFSGLELKMHDSVKDIPMIFSALSNARESLVTQWHATSYSAGTTRRPASERMPTITPPGTWKQKSTSILARWSSAYDVYLDIRGDSLTNEKRKGTAALSILKELGSTAKVLAQTTVDDQKNWDDFCPMFQNVVLLAEDIVELELNPTGGRPPFCIDMAIVGPLFQVCCRCRDPKIRRKAISILQRCGRTEGEWKAFPTSKVAQRVIDIEEAELQSVKSCEDVPGWARISNVSPIFDHSERKATLTYSWPGGGHSLDGQLIEEIVVW